MLNFTPLGCLELVKKFSVGGGGGWFESKFSVSFGPIVQGLKYWIRTLTKLNNK